MTDYDMVVSTSDTGETLVSSACLGVQVCLQITEPEAMIRYRLRGCGEEWEPFWRSSNFKTADVELDDIAKGFGEICGWLELSE